MGGPGNPTKNRTVLVVADAVAYVALALCVGLAASLALASLVVLLAGDAQAAAAAPPVAQVALADPHALAASAAQAAAGAAARLDPAQRAEMSIVDQRNLSLAGAGLVLVLLTLIRAWPALLGRRSRG